MKAKQFKSWFKQVLLNRCLDRQKSTRQRTIYSSKENSVKPHRLSLDTLLFEKENQHLLKIAMQALKPKERAAVILHYYQGFSYKQVADILGMSVNVFISLLLRARSQLQQQLTKLIAFPSKKNHDNR